MPDATEPKPVAQSTNMSKQKMSSLAVVGFILSFFTGIIGLVISLVALIRLRKNGERGKGLAVAGLCISAALILIVAAIVIPTAITVRKNWQETQTKRARIEARIEKLDKELDSSNKQFDAFHTSMATSDALVKAFNENLKATPMIDPHDTKADRDKAQSNADIYKQVEKDVDGLFDTLADEETFSIDTGAKDKLNAAQQAWKTNRAGYDQIITGYEGFAQRKFDVYNNLVDNEQSIADAENAFVKALDALDNYIVDKNNSLVDEVDLLKQEKSTQVSALSALNERAADFTNFLPGK